MLKTSKRPLRLVLIAVLLWGSAFSLLARGPKSAGVLTFAAENVLFLADSTRGAIYAYQVPPVENPEPEGPYNLTHIDRTIAAYLGTQTRYIQIKDLAVHPATGEAYISVGRAGRFQYLPSVLIVNRKGEVRELDLVETPHDHIYLGRRDQEFHFWEDYSGRSLTFTDIDYHEGKLYVSGLSATDFSAVLRIIDYPFNDRVTETSVEIYHAIHDQNETRAPIRSLEIIEIDGETHLLAAFTCTPLVTIPLADLHDGAHIRGKTIAELGYGNTPIDLVGFTASDFSGNPFEAVLLSNKNRSAQLMRLEDIAASNRQPGMTTPVFFGTGGTPFTSVPMTGIMHMDNLDNAHLLTLRRNPDNGSVELVSFLKNLYFRLSDFQSEYEFPDYQYPADGSQDVLKSIQNTMKADEGYPHKVVE